MARLFGVGSTDEIIFVRNTTEAINLVARTWGDANLRSGDVVVLSEMEHHSNLVPWQLVAARTGATLEFIHVDDNGLLRLEDLDRHPGQRRNRLVVCHVSSILGTINPRSSRSSRGRTTTAHSCSSMARRQRRTSV
ncbi:MAG: aminotransferase class V-fold PLP-dependent enzyme [Thermomicrobiales bacterium]|nr:aminotransferase class V-fold PLP-dependent enzyme [Thermomicrobiales bacterium]